MIMDMLIDTLSALGETTQAQGMQPPTASDVRKFENFMAAQSGQDLSVEIVTPASRASFDREAEAIRQRATDFVNNVSANRLEIEAMGKDILKNLDSSDPRSQLVMLNYSSKMMQSSTELTFITNVGQSVEKNTKMLFQSQA
jgi:hypothetical protein